MSIKDTLNAELATAQQALADAEAKYHATVAQVQADWDAAKEKAAALEQVATELDKGSALAAGGRPMPSRMPTCYAWMTPSGCTKSACPFLHPKEQKGAVHLYAPSSLLQGGERQWVLFSPQSRPALCLQTLWYCDDGGVHCI